MSDLATVIAPVIVAGVILICVIFWLVWRLYPRTKTQNGKLPVPSPNQSPKFQLPLHYKTLDPWVKGTPGPRAMLNTSVNNSVNSVKSARSRSVGSKVSGRTEVAEPPPYIKEKLPRSPQPAYLV